ncbi:MAG: pentapeptide repeat-containing protein [Gammaproteobacteria bacterium]|nr:pentapeptide repeat-containing protein [Gammaproteobacteria bacterium]
MIGIADRRSGNGRRVTPEDETRVHYIDRRKSAPTIWDKAGKAIVWSMQTLLLPGVLIAVGYFFSERLENSQRLSTKEIAAAQLKSTSVIEEKKLHIQRIKELGLLRQDIVKDLAQTHDIDKEAMGTIKEKIKSMTIYEETALPFLVSIKAFTAARIDNAGNDDEHLALGEIRNVISETILNSVKTVQFDMTGTQFKKGDNLRFAVLRNAKLNDSVFAKTNLFSADFSNSELTNADFSEAELQKVNFRNAHLKNARFRKAYLAGADFTGAKLRDADFIGAHDVSAAIIPANLLAGPIFSPEDFRKLINKNGEAILALGNAERYVCFLWQRYTKECENVEACSGITEANRKTIIEYFDGSGFTFDLQAALADKDRQKACSRAQPLWSANSSPVDTQSVLWIPG